MGGTTGGPRLPQRAATSGTDSSAPPPAGLPGVGGTDGYGGFGKSFLTDSVGPGGANRPHDVQTASSFLAHNGFMDAPTKEASDGFFTGLENLRGHIDRLTQGGAPSSTKVEPDSAFELLAQRAVSAGHLTAPDSFSATPPAPASSDPAPATAASTPGQSPAQQARTAAKVIDPSPRPPQAPSPHKPLPNLPTAAPTPKNIAAPITKGETISLTQSGIPQGAVTPSLSLAPYQAVTYPRLPAPANLAKIGIAADPAPDVPFSQAFRNELHMQESAKDDYKAVHYNQEGRATALGRYQLTTAALKDAGLKDNKTGEWTGKYGIRNAADFLNNPRAQELAAADYHAKNIRYLEQKGAFAQNGHIFLGVGGPTTITEAGIVAAAHRYGANNVSQYLEHIAAHNGISDQRTFPSDKKKAYLAIETRLRSFQNIPLR